MSKQRSGLFSGTKGSKLGRIIPGQEGVVTGVRSRTLGRNMLKAMGVSNHKWSGYQAQHIIPVEMKNHPVLKRIGMDLDDANNGIFLRIPGKDVSMMSRHRGYHAAYSKFVRQELDKISLSSDVQTIQRQVFTLQQRLKKLQSSGLPLYSSAGSNVGLWKKYYNKLK